VQFSARADDANEARSSKYNSRKLLEKTLRWNTNATLYCILYWYCFKDFISVIRCKIF